MIGGCPEKYRVGAFPEETRKYYEFSDEVKAVVEARGIVADDCCSFLSKAPISDKLHVDEEAAESWAAYCVAQSMNAACVGPVQKQLFKRHADLVKAKGEPYSYESRDALVNDVRLKLLHKELVLAEVIAEQGDADEFAVVPPAFSNNEDDGGSDHEDMGKRHRSVVERREIVEGTAEASVAVPVGIAPSSSRSVPVDLENSDEESGAEEGEDPLPPINYPRVAKQHVA